MNAIEIEIFHGSERAVVMAYSGKKVKLITAAHHWKAVNKKGEQLIRHFAKLIKNRHFHITLIK
ncbi:MAG: hypothetical protein AMS17_12305 [Spirochaetes bacterium DG_61]|nr:MAG: hypothetical protein AMS17_12305 [Spirochaetes bacterium DG_61]